MTAPLGHTVLRPLHHRRNPGMLASIRGLVQAGASKTSGYLSFVRLAFVYGVLVGGVGIEPPTRAAGYEVSAVIIRDSAGHRVGRPIRSHREFLPGFRSGFEHRWRISEPADSHRGENTDFRSRNLTGIYERQAGGDSLAHFTTINFPNGKFLRLESVVHDPRAQIGAGDHPSVFKGLVSLSRSASAGAHRDSVGSSPFIERTKSLPNRDDQTDDGSEAQEGCGNRPSGRAPRFMCCFFSSDGGAPLSAQIGSVVILSAITSIGILVGVGRIRRLRRFRWLGLASACAAVLLFSWLLSGS